MTNYSWISKYNCHWQWHAQCTYNTMQSMKILEQKPICKRYQQIITYFWFFVSFSGSLSDNYVNQGCANIPDQNRNGQNCKKKCDLGGFNQANGLQNWFSTGCIGQVRLSFPNLSITEPNREFYVDIGLGPFACANERVKNV